MSTITSPIPLSRPFIDDREEELVLGVLRSGRLSLGPWIERFEGLLAERVGARHAIAVSSGTGGLHLCMRVAGLGPGDEVITTPFSFVASANCAIFEGATPVFVDIDPRTLNIDPAAVESAVTDRTRAIVAVDVFGYPCELDALAYICERQGLMLIEDACEALGAEYKGRRIGSHDHLSVFAFYPNKQITTGEGGAVMASSHDVAALLASLRNQGRSDLGGWLDHRYLGYNYRLSDLAAAVGVAQLEKLEEILRLRDEVASRYADLLVAVDGIEPPLRNDADHRRSWFVYVVQLAEEIDRDRVIERLEREGIASSRYFPAIHLQPYMRERLGFRDGMFPVCEAISRRTVALPFFTQLGPGDQERVVEALHGAIS